MKKLALFLGGVLVGAYGLCCLIMYGEQDLDTTLCETDEYQVKLATPPRNEIGLAVVRSK